MAEIDNSIPLNTLMSRQKPIYQGQPMTDLMNYGIQQDENAQKRKESADKKYREDMTRKVFGEALANGVDLDKAAQAVAKYDPDLAYRLLTQYRLDQTAKEKALSDRDSESVRIKLVSALNTINGRIAQMDSTDPQLADTRDLATSIQEEISSDTPSIQRAFTLIKLTEAQLAAIAKEKSDKLLAGGDGSDKKVISTDLPEGVTLDSSGQPIRNGKISNTLTDWYKSEMVDGYNKPVPYTGVTIDNATGAASPIKLAYDKALSDWEANNNTQKAKNKLSAEKAEIDKKGAEIAKRYSTKASGAVTALGSMATQLTSLIDKFNKGNYDLANFTDLKSTMADGRMTDSDVGLALGLSATEGVWQNALASLTGGKAGVAKLKDKGAAQDAINRTISAYNLALKNMANPPFTGKYAESAKKAWSDNSYSTDFSNLPASFTSVGGGSSTQKPSTIIPVDKVEGDVWNDNYFTYTIRGGNLMSKPRVN